MMPGLRKYHPVFIAFILLKAFSPLYFRRCSPLYSFAGEIWPLLLRGFFELFFYFLFIIPATSSVAQDISFQVSGSAEIVITPLSPQELCFRSLTINRNEVCAIGLRGMNEEDAVVLAVDAPAACELQIWTEVTDHLEISDYMPVGGEEMPTIPFRLRFAYANAGYSTSHSSVYEARAAAVEVPAGFSTVTFPVSNGYGGLTATPQPGLTDYTESPVRSYLFFYGTVGPASQGTNVVAGTYQSEILVNIELNNPNTE